MEKFLIEIMAQEDLDIILLYIKRNMYKAVKNHVKIRISRKYYCFNPENNGTSGKK